MEGFIDFGPFFWFGNISWFEKVFGFETFCFDLKHYLAQKTFSWFEKYLTGLKNTLEVWEIFKGVWETVSLVLKTLS